MLSMGITLSPKDFVNVMKRPNAVMVGFVFCYAMMPALAYALGIGAGLSPPLLAGLVLVGCINGGQASNLCTFIANGNVSGRGRFRLRWAVYYLHALLPALRRGVCLAVLLALLVRDCTHAFGVSWFSPDYSGKFRNFRYCFQQVPGLFFTRGRPLSRRPIVAWHTIDT